jgi:hypothetical protein
VNGGTCDPFAVDEDRWLEVLARDYGAAFLITVNGGRWYGILRDGSGAAFICETPGDLAVAMGDALQRNAR